MFVIGIPLVRDAAVVDGVVGFRGDEIAIADVQSELLSQTERDADHTLIGKHGVLVVNEVTAASSAGVETRGADAESVFAPQPVPVKGAADHPPIDEARLARIAAAGGGRYYLADDARTLPAIFTDAAQRVELVGCARKQSLL